MFEFHLLEYGMQPVDEINTNYLHGYEESYKLLEF